MPNTKRTWLVVQLTEVRHFELLDHIMVTGTDEEDADKAWAATFGLSSDALDIVDDSYVYDDGEKRVTLRDWEEITDPGEAEVLCRYLPVCKHQE